MSCDMWFGTQDYATWIQTPQRGADVSAHGWNESGNFLNGSAFAFNSYNTHKEFDFSWRTTSSRKEAQTMMSFYSGTFGRGKIYFLDPLTMQTNVLPARWADPSITCDFEGGSLVPGVDPVRVSQTNTDRLQLPVTAAQYDLSGITEVETSFNVEATNLFTNPNLVGDGTYATVAENLFTNPNLVGDGTWAEVRRNRVLNPTFSSLAGWGAARADMAPDTAVRRRANGPGSVRMTTNVNAAGVYLISTAAAASRVTIVPGSPFSARASVLFPESGPYSASLAMYEYDAAGALLTPVLDSPALPASTGGWIDLTSTFTPKPEAATVRMVVNLNGYKTVGQTAWVCEPMVETVTTSDPYFDGSTTPETTVGVVQPEDFRWRWVGAENASESVMEIERVRGMTGIRCTPGLSTHPETGEAALRLIPAGGSASQTGFALFSIPPEARGGGTLIGSSYSVQDSTGSHTKRKLGVQTPLQVTPDEAPPVGNFSHRFYYSALSSNNQVILYGNGSARDAGDVWWTDIGLFAGNYTGGVFSGDTAPEDVEGLVQPEDFRIRWSGAVNNSSSVMEIERVQGLSTNRLTAGVSTKNGKPAVRLIPDGTGNDSFMSPAQNPTTEPVTIVGTVVIDEPLPAPPGSAQLGVYTIVTVNDAGTAGVSVSAENTSGSHSLRGFDPRPLRGARWYHGGRTGSGDVWWTDIALFAGEYDGEAFSGDSEVPGKITRWTGTPNDSPSEIGHLTLSTPSVISDSNALFIPLPDGMQLNVGAFYQSTTAGQGVYVTPATRGGGNTGVAARLAPITPSATDTLPNTFTKTPGVIGVWVWIGKTAQGPGVVTVNALHARVSPLGAANTREAHWYGGQGNEGVRFLQPPTYINNTGRDGGQIEFAATFTEVSF